jgi:hypothetical protein
VHCYEKAADQGHPQAAFHGAICRHFGVGVDVDLAEAATCYLLPTRIAEPMTHSFRCLRLLNKARASPYPRSRPSKRAAQASSVPMCAPPTTSPSVRSYLRPPVVADERFVIGAGGFSV